ncbi:MAG: hypothetical protein EAZ34_08470 [Polaromonas sp.]|nr:MAG: hypothetical protein EAZ34_08470 [Polaromonas sp.]
MAASGAGQVVALQRLWGICAPGPGSTHKENKANGQARGLRCFFDHGASKRNFKNRNTSQRY